MRGVKVVFPGFIDHYQEMMSRSGGIRNYSIRLSQLQQRLVIIFVNADCDLRSVFPLYDLNPCRFSQERSPFPLARFAENFELSLRLGTGLAVLGGSQGQVSQPRILCPGWASSLLSFRFLRVGRRLAPLQ